MYHDDDRFYTPRAQASTSRSTASYGTPRSSSDPSSARSNPPFHSEYESNRGIYQYQQGISIRNVVENQDFSLHLGAYAPALLEPSAPSISYHPPTESQPNDDETKFSTNRSM
jgi:hypothetical protein